MRQPRHVDAQLDLVAPADLPTRLFRCTPTRLLTWVDCPRRYRFTYLDRPAPAKGPSWAHNGLGAAVHAALAAWWRLAPGQRTPARAGELVETGWSGEGFRDPAQSARWRARARGMVARYAAGLDPTEEPLGVERTVGARTTGLALSGRVDRLDLRATPAGGEDLVVVDYKTGRHVPSTEDARTSLALALYALATGRMLRRPCHRVELHHLPSGQVVSYRHTEESLARHLQRAEWIAAEAGAGHAGHSLDLPEPRRDALFPARPGRLCEWCDYRGSCPDAAGSARQPWDGLGPEGEVSG